MIELVPTQFVFDRRRVTDVKKCVAFHCSKVSVQMNNSDGCAGVKAPLCRQCRKMFARRTKIFAESVFASIRFGPRMQCVVLHKKCCRFRLIV